MCVLDTHLCLTLCEPMDYSSPGSSVHGILQARILEWVAISFSYDVKRTLLFPKLHDSFRESLATRIGNASGR